MAKDEEFFQWAKAFNPNFKANELGEWLDQSPVSPTTISLLQQAMKNHKRINWTAMRVVSDSVLEDGLITAYEGMQWGIERKRFPCWEQIIDVPGGKAAKVKLFNHTIDWLTTNEDFPEYDKSTISSAGKLLKHDEGKLIGYRYPLTSIATLNYINLGMGWPTTEDEEINLLAKSSYYGVLMAYYDAGVVNGEA